MKNALFSFIRNGKRAFILTHSLKVREPGGEEGPIPVAVEGEPLLVVALLPGVVEGGLLQGEEAVVRRRGEAVG